MSSLFAFPGQGAQRPGMLQGLLDDASGRGCLEEASDVLGESLLRLDSREALASTRAVQLCLLVAGVTAARGLLQRNAPPDYVAGLSIGAYPAAVIAGALDYADAVRLVALRGELMQRAYPSGYGMTALIGLDQSSVERLIDSESEPVFLANINAEQQFVIAGSDNAMQRVAQRALGMGARAAKRLAMSVPSHCPLLEKPAMELAQAFAAITLRRPAITFLSSNSARPVHTAEALRDDLAFNMCRRVDWAATVRTAWERGVRLLVELPPGAVLSGLARPVFNAGTVVACQDARADTLDVLLRREADTSSPPGFAQDG